MGRRAFWLGSLARSSQLRDSAGLQKLCAPDFPPYLRGLIFHGTDEQQSTDGCWLQASVAFQAVLRGHPGLGMGPLGPGTEGSTLGPIENSTTEIRIGNLGIGEAALHQHGVA